jgi:hypothetical protein
MTPFGARVIVLDKFNSENPVVQEIRESTETRYAECDSDDC